MKNKKKYRISVYRPWKIIIILCFMISSPCYHFSESNNSTSIRLLGMEFIFIPSGELITNTKKEEPGENLGNKLHINGFYMLKHEVTFDQYDKFCEETKRKKPSDAELAKGNWKKMGMDVSIEGLKKDRGSRPVINVSWYDAKAYCNWISKKFGKKVRLPYETEWEYACRTGETELPEEIDSVAWYAGNSSMSTHIVMQKKANKYGIYDMLGNVWEWCEDVYKPLILSKKNFFKTSNTINGEWRVVKGGSWINKAEVCTSSRRRGCHPEDTGSGLGFRIVFVNEQ